ncbi:MAG: hypothetical protein ACRDY6_21935 [Acidimicrobiia bacterium]
MRVAGARDRALLDAAGFGAVKVDEAPVTFRFRDLDKYLSFMADIAGPSRSRYKSCRIRTARASRPHSKPLLAPS